jgi:hypothetical protein
VVPKDDPTHWCGSEATVSGSSAYAAALNGIKAGERWAGYSVAGALPRSSEFAIDGSIHGLSAGSVCEVLAGLEFCESPWTRIPEG